MCDTPPGGACTLTDVWDFSSALGPWPVMISSPLRGGGLAGAVGSSNTCDLCRASWWGLTTCGFLGSGSKEGFGTGWVGSPNTLDCCRLCWLSLWWVALGSGGGASEVKTLDLFRAAWHWFTSLLEGSGWGLESLPNKLIEVLPPGGASTFVEMLVESVTPIWFWVLDMISCLDKLSFYTPQWSVWNPLANSTARSPVIQNLWQEVHDNDNRIPGWKNPHWKKISNGFISLCVSDWSVC